MAPGGRRNRVNTNPVSMPSLQEGSPSSGGRRSQNNAYHISGYSTQEGATSSGTKKNGQKRSVNYKLTEFLRMGGARPRIEILPELTRPLGPWAKEWSTEIGLIVRHHVPLRCRTWKEVKKGNKLVTLFERVLKKSAINKKSRSSLEVLHRGDAKCFARHRANLANPVINVQLDVISLYTSTHHSLKKGQVAPRAEENFERMVEMSTQPSEEGGDPPTANAVREAVLGMRSGYACGLGYGVVGPTCTTAVVAAAGAAATAAAHEEIDQLRQRAQSVEDELRELRSQQINHQRQLEYIISQLGGMQTPPRLRLGRRMREE